MSNKINREGQLEFEELLRNYKKKKTQGSQKPIVRYIQTEDPLLIDRNEIASSYIFLHQYFARDFFKNHLTDYDHFLFNKRLSVIIILAEADFVISGTSLLLIVIFLRCREKVRETIRYLNVKFYDRYTIYRIWAPFSCCPSMVPFI